MVVTDILDKVTGVIHVGANEGQERGLYSQYDLDVLWFEPLPSAYEKLQQNLVGLPKQRAYQFAVSNYNGEALLYVTDNEGQSSSIRELYKHKDVWPDVHHVDTIRVYTITLDFFFQAYEVYIRRAFSVIGFGCPRK